jgi:hypothetical protein
MNWNVPTMEPFRGERTAHRGGVESGGRAARDRAAASREAEVEELRAGAREHHVARLEIAMHDARPVRAVEGVGDLDAETEHVVDRERPALNAIRERLALDQLHDEVEIVPLAPDVVDDADVRMVERGNEPRLALEARADLGRACQIARQDLDRDLAAEAAVAGAIDLAHASGADGREDLVGA